jgi:hypothetical protein
LIAASPASPRAVAPRLLAAVPEDRRQLVLTCFEALPREDRPHLTDLVAGWAPLDAALSESLLAVALGALGGTPDDDALAALPHLHPSTLPAAERALARLGGPDRTLRRIEATRRAIRLRSTILEELAR